MDALRLEAGLLGELAQDQERARPGERAAAGVEEQVGPVAPVEMRAAERQIAANGLRRRPAERDDALLVALAEHADDAGVDVDRRCGRGRPSRRRGARRRTCSSTSARSRSARGVVPFAASISRSDSDGESVRGSLRDPARRRDPGGRVVVAEPEQQLVAEVRAHRGDAAPDRRRRRARRRASTRPSPRASLGRRRPGRRPEERGEAARSRRYASTVRGERCAASRSR